MSESSQKDSQEEEKWRVAVRRDGESDAKLVSRFLSRLHADLDKSGVEATNALADRGDRARLRRCKKLEDVLFTPLFFDVRNKLSELGYGVSRGHADSATTDRDLRLACALGLVAWVDTNDGSKSFSRQLARKREEGGDAKLSGLRFRRLLEIEDRDSLFRKMISVVRLLDKKKINVRSLAEHVYSWSPETGNWVRRRWAEDYYTSARQEP